MSPPSASADAPGPPAVMVAGERAYALRGLRAAASAAAPALPACIGLGLMLLWAAHDGGYDADTWYWGALVLVGALSALIVSGRSALRTLPRSIKLGLGAFGCYLAFSYASISWAAYPGDALTGSNRTLLYLVVMLLFAATRWTVRRATAALTAFAAGVGVIGCVLLVRLASGGAAAMFSEGRLVAPAGYFNASAALFTTGTLLAVTLSVRRELPVLVRAVLIALACGELELAVLAQSRGWLFTLPLVLLLGAVLVRDRLRTLVAAAIPAATTIVLLHKLLAVYQTTLPAHPVAGALTHAAARAGEYGLWSCVGALAVGGLLAGVDKRLGGFTLSRRWRQAVGLFAALAVVGVAGVGVQAVTHGDPIGFLERQWHGFTHPGAVYTSAGSHFASVGTGRYDAWRVALDAFLAHPIGGLGQDNFADYYIRHRRTGEELQWTHSIEMRLLAHTGLVGTLLFVVFLAAVLGAALRTRRRADARVSALAGAALLPLVVWLIHGSVDWFWEIPALSGPALAFLMVAGRLRSDGADPRTVATPRRRSSSRLAFAAAGIVAQLAAVAVLAFPYLAVRQVSSANDIRDGKANAALADLRSAGSLDPLSADPGRIGGTIALQIGDYGSARGFFAQAVAREPGGWYGWLGAGLAESALGQRSLAYRDFKQAAELNSQQPAVTQALRRVNSKQPLTPAAALQMLVLSS